MAGSSVVKRARTEKVKSRSLFDEANGPRVMEPPPAVFALAPEAKVTEAYDAWWTYAFERQEIYFKRLRGEPEPWTEDDVLRRYRFTNVYRAADRVSQYLIRNVIYRDGLPTEPDEVVFRILLFKVSVARSNDVSTICSLARCRRYALGCAVRCGAKACGVE